MLPLTEVHVSGECTCSPQTNDSGRHLGGDLCQTSGASNAHLGIVLHQLD